MSDFQHLDEQMNAWSARLRDDLKVTPEASNALASCMASEIAALPSDLQNSLRHGNPVPLPARIDELRAAQGFMDLASTARNNPVAIRAQVLVQHYVAFVYMGDYLFVPLRKAPESTMVRRVCRFLTDNPVRAFRNAIAHGNWCYKDDYSGLRFWAKKGSDAEEPMCDWEVEQNDLNFWQALARCTAYCTVLTLDSNLS